MYREPHPVNVNQSAGIGFVGLLTIVFIVLKLTGYIAWSWLWVLAPIWISVLLWLVFIVVILSLYLKYNK